MNVCKGEGWVYLCVCLSVCVCVIQQEYGTNNKRVIYLLSKTAR